MENSLQIHQTITCSMCKTLWHSPAGSSHILEGETLKIIQRYDNTVQIINMLIIYKPDICPSSRTVLMIADILKLNYKTVNTEFAKKEHEEPEFIKKNPIQNIPLLEDGDFTLADGHAILTYLVSKYGADLRGELYPSDLTLKATIDQRLFFNASILLPNCKKIINNKETEPNEKQIVDANKGFEVLEKYLKETRFVACDYLTIADIAIVATVSAIAEFIPIENSYEHLQVWLDLLKKQEWFLN